MRAQQSIQAIGAQAEEMEREGRWNEAAEGYRQILTLDPKSIAALNRLGALYVREGRFAEGMKFYRERSSRSANFGTNLNLGIAFLKEQDYPTRSRRCSRPCSATRRTCKRANCWRFPSLARRL